MKSKLDAQLRREQLQLLERHEAEIRKSCQELAQLTVAAWEMFLAVVD